MIENALVHFVNQLSKFIALFQMENYGFSSRVTTFNPFGAKKALLK